MTLIYKARISSPIKANSP